jgi:hypothetical protein
MYINVLSKSIVSIRPDDYEEDMEDSISLEKQRNAQLALEEEDSNGLPIWNLPNVRLWTKDIKS